MPVVIAQREPVEPSLVVAMFAPEPSLSSRRICREISLLDTSIIVASSETFAYEWSCQAVGREKNSPSVAGY